MLGVRSEDKTELIVDSSLESSLLKRERPFLSLGSLDLVLEYVPGSYRDNRVWTTALPHFFGSAIVVVVSQRVKLSSTANQTT